MNKCIISLVDDKVTFKYQPMYTKDCMYMTLPATVFMARFLQHILPRGFCKVRYYGYLHQRCTDKLNSIRAQLELPPVIIPPEKPKKYYCRHCGTELMSGNALERMRAPPCPLLFNALSASPDCLVPSRSGIVLVYAKPAYLSFR